MTKHPYNPGDRVLVHTGNRSERATVTGICWCSFGRKPYVYIKLDNDRDTGQKGVYKFSCGPLLKPFGAVDLLAEIAP